jgi:hypothetical protein
MLLMASAVTADHAGVAHTVTIASGGITVECFTSEDGQTVTVSGNVEVASGTADFELTLMGNDPPGSGFDPTGLTVIIDNAGPGTYPYSFDVTALVGTYNAFRVDSTSDFVNPEKSRSFNVDECSRIIPEAPLTVLLLLTAGLAAVLFVRRRSTATG